MVVALPLSVPSITGLSRGVLLCPCCFYLQFLSEMENGVHNMFFSCNIHHNVCHMFSIHFCKYIIRTYACYSLTLLCQHLSEMSVKDAFLWQYKDPLNAIKIILNVLGCFKQNFMHYLELISRALFVP